MLFLGMPFRVATTTCLSLFAFASLAWADGGTVRAMVDDGGLRIAVFTTPTVTVAGEIDFSVLVQDADTLTPLPNATIRVELVPIGREYAAEQVIASRELATNALFQDCRFDLQAGEYGADVTVRDGDREGHAKFRFQVGSKPTQTQRFWPWYSWPVIPLVLMAWQVIRTGQRSSTMGM